MDTAVQQQTDSNGQTIVTPNERQALIQKLQEKSFEILSNSIFIYRHSKWPLDLSTRIENQAFEKSHGLKVDQKFLEKRKFIYNLIFF